MDTLATERVGSFIDRLIIPFLVLAPLGTLIVGVRSRRRLGRARSPQHHQAAAGRSHEPRSRALS